MAQRGWRLPVLAAAIAMGCPARAEADPFSAFTYCAPPVRPVCVDRATKSIETCEGEVQLFVASVFKYRECLEHETERAVREANEVIQAQRCKSDKTRCVR